MSYFYISVFVCVSLFMFVRVSVSLWRLCMCYLWFLFCVSRLLHFSKTIKDNSLLLFPKKFRQKGKKSAGQSLFRESNLFQLSFKVLIRQFIIGFAVCNIFTHTNIYYQLIVSHVSSPLHFFQGTLSLYSNTIFPVQYQYFFLQIITYI